MSFSNRQAQTLAEWVDARDWPAIGAIKPVAFQQQWPVFLNEYLTGTRDNLDDLLTLGVVCGGYPALRFADTTIAWLEQQCSPPAVEIACNALAGFWHPQLYQGDIDSALLDRLLQHCSPVAAQGNALPGYQALLQQIVSMPAAQMLSERQRTQLDMARGDGGEQAQ